MLAAFERHFAAFIAMLENPDDEATVDAVMATVVGDMELTVENTLELLAERNQLVIPNPEVSTAVIIVDESLTMDQNGAGFDACLIDGGTLVDRDAANPTPGPPTSRSVTYSLSKIDGVWLTANLDFFAEFPGEIGCG